MSHLDILLPFGLPPQELAADLFRQLRAPALATLLARAGVRQETHDEYARSLPHEHWIARQFGRDTADDNSPALAGNLMQHAGVEAENGLWFILNPVHFHIARDHLVLTDPKRLQLDEQEARALFDVAQPLFYEFDKTLLYGNSNTWFLRADEWAALSTSTPGAAIGHNIDIWLPKGTGDRSWRKLQNEVQMVWFSHEVNAAREALGKVPVNSLWLWGASPWPPTAVGNPYSHACGLSGWMRVLSEQAGAQTSDGDAEHLLAARPAGALLMLDALMASALAGDWGQWLAEMERLENAWFAPVLAALKRGRISRMTLTVTDHARIAAYTATRRSLLRFWVQPSYSPLLP